MQGPQVLEEPADRNQCLRLDRITDQFREGAVTEENSWYSRIGEEPAAEAGIIVRAFREHGIEIGGASDPAHEDEDVTPNGVGFMYAEGHILTREQYLGGVQGIRGPQRIQTASRQRGVLDVLQDHGVGAVEVERVVRDIVLLRLNVRGAPSGDAPSGGDDGAPGTAEGDRGGTGTPEGDRGSAEGELPSVLDLLDRIDEEFGEGIATPDHVLTAANGLMGPCSATEPQEVYPTAGPYPAVCRDGGARVRIFIADTGLLHDAAKIFPWLDGVRGDPDPRTHLGGTIHPYGGHGTFVAGVLRCIAPEAQIHVANIFNIAGSALESHFVRRLNEAFGFGFEILHLTASCMTRNNAQLMALDAWLELLGSYKGVVCVAPAGNNHTRRPSWPGALPGVISVGALATDQRHRADFSDYGGWVDVYAPGQKLINAFGRGTYTCQIPPNAGQVETFSGLAQWSGTSFSAPIVTGLIAARMARRGESAREAAAALLAKARAQAIPGVGPVLLPGCHDGEDEHGEHCGCGCGGGCRGGCGCGGGCAGRHGGHGHTPR
jgi:Subtilase family